MYVEFIILFEYTIYMHVLKINLFEKVLNK